MQVDNNPFLINTIDLQNSKVLIRPEQGEAAKGKNVVISENRTITADEKILSREVVVEKTIDDKESLKVTIKAPTLGGGRPKPRLQRRRRSSLKLRNRSDLFMLPVRPVQPRGGGSPAPPVIPVSHIG
jgi:hypothetical protein